MVTDTELNKYGYTSGCPGCKARQHGLPAKKGHSETCRGRIEKLMMEDPDDRQKVQDAHMRMAHYTARRMEMEDERRVQRQANSSAEAQTHDSSGVASHGRAA